MPTILIAEDLSVIRIGVIFLIKELYPNAEIVEAETFEQILSLVTTRDFDLLILDINIPGADNFQVMEAIQLRSADLPVLIFSGLDEQLYALHYIRAGAMGYLSKRAPTEKMKSAIQQVLKGEKFISKEVQKLLINSLVNTKKGNIEFERLSARELEVMKLLIRGAGNPEIKAILNIRDSTISTYKNRIFEKMNVSNVIELSEKAKHISNLGPIALLKPPLQ